MKTQHQQLIANRYLLQELIRSLGGIELYAAQDTRLDRPVMVQRLAVGVPGDSELARGFLRHQQVASSIHDCPLLSVYDAGLWEERPFSVMEREKGGPATALYRPGHPPDVPTALKVTRQAAEALQCCRDAGLTDWTFSPEALSVDADGNGWLAIIEGLDGQYSSSSMEHDAQALCDLLRLMLVGHAEASFASRHLPGVPTIVSDLLERMAPDKAGSLRHAGEVGIAIAAIEQVAYQPTQANDALAAIPSGNGSNTTLVFESIPATPADAPTLAAQVDRDAQASFSTHTQLGGYVPVQADSNAVAGKANRLPILAAIGALLLVGLLLVVVLPRLRPAQVNAGTSSDAQTQVLKRVPDLHGKGLEDARNAVGAEGLNLALGDALHHPTFALDTVVRQEPEAGAELQAGNLITVSLSLGPEAQPTVPPQNAAPAPQAQPPAQQPQPPAAKEAPRQNAPEDKSRNRDKKDERKKDKDGDN